MNKKPLRLSTRLTPTAIRDREDFVTHGSMEGWNVRRLPMYDSGRLSGDDLARFKVDSPFIRYVVLSYATPIAWWREDTGWHVVAQKFSPTTSRHQGCLYLCRPVRDDGEEGTA